MTKDITCIVCPKGCRIAVDTENPGNISGYSCPKGLEYAKNELLHPVRTVTSTVRVAGGERPVVAVRTKTDIPKDKIFDCMAVINTVEVPAPVRIGDVLIGNVCGTGVDVVATANNWAVG